MLSTYLDNYLIDSELFKKRYFHGVDKVHEETVDDDDQSVESSHN